MYVCDYYEWLGFRYHLECAPDVVKMAGQRVTIRRHTWRDHYWGPRCPVCKLRVDVWQEVTDSGSVQ